MKNILLLIIMSVFSVRVFGQHTNSITIERTDNHSASINLKNTVGFWHLSGPRSYESNNRFSLMWNGGNGYERFLTVLDNGNVGIGVGSPLAKLEVRGALRASYSSSRYLVMHSSSDGNSYINYTRGSSTSRLGFQINGSSKLSIMDNGNVGIGTTSPQSKLAVNGQIRAKEVKVLADITVPDYVFESNYKLRSLRETKTYIAENKHLPEIPSAAEIGQDRPGRYEHAPFEEN